MKRSIAWLVILALAPALAHATNRKPLVIGASGQQQQLQASDWLIDAAGDPFGVLTGSFTIGHCLQAGATAHTIVDAGAACGTGAGTVTSVSSANGDITVATGTTTPVLTAVSSPKWDTGRTISITGDLAYTSPSLDGSANVTAAGTLATVNSGPGSCGDATHVCQITTNGKGLTTAQSAVGITQPTAANPSASVGLSAVNGSASTFLRSDGAPPLDQSIVPTWTGTHTFQKRVVASLASPPASTSGGFADTSTITSISGGLSYISLFARPTFNAASSITEFDGVDVSLVLQAGTIPVAYGVSSQMITTGSTVTNAYGYYAQFRYSSGSYGTTYSFEDDADSGVISATRWGYHQTATNHPNLFASTTTFSGTVNLPGLSAGAPLCTDGSKNVTTSGCPGGSGTVTSVTSANGDITVANTTTTPVLTAVSAPKLDTGRTIAITGDLAWTSPSFDGSANVTAAGTLATVNSNTGSCGDATHVAQVTLNGKGLATACAAVAITGASGANPTASLGLTAVNGSAATFMRSDAAPALSQSIAPTWSGLHTFSAGGVITPEATPATNEIGYLGAPIDEQDASYTLALSDCGKTVRANTASTLTYTIDKNANKNYPVGCIMVLRNYGAGSLTVTPTSPATLIPDGSGTSGSITVAQYGRATIQQEATDVWDVIQAPGWNLIGTTVTAGSQTSVTFSSIPGGYKHLMLLFSGQSASASEDEIWLQFNSDTGANYYTGIIYNSSSSATAFYTNADTGGVPACDTASSTQSGSFGTGCSVSITGYSNTSSYKTVTSQNVAMAGTGSTNIHTRLYGGYWKNTAAISTIKAYFSSGSAFVNNSIVSLYAIN